MLNDKSHLFLEKKYSDKLDSYFTAVNDRSIIINGKWKLLIDSTKKTKSILINTEEDISETKDYSGSHPKIKKSLVNIHKTYMKENSLQYSK